MKKFLQVALLSLVAGASAMAGPITIDNSAWTEFSFGGVGSPAGGNPFTFTALSDVFLSVTDSGLSGDRFEIFIDSVSVGQTSASGSFGDGIGNNYDAAFADPRWSSGSYLLGPGVYSVDIFTTVSPFGGGGAALRVDTAIPEPATFGLLGVALLGVGIARRKLAR